MKSLQLISLLICIFSYLKIVQAQADCGVNGAQLANLNTACICKSSYSGANCETSYTDPATNCPASWGATMVDGALNVDTSGNLATQETLVTSEFIRWAVSIPVNSDRTYTDVIVGTCVDGTSLAEFTHAAMSCFDVLYFQMAVTDLRSCGFSYENSIVDNIQYANYTEQIEIRYTEKTELAGNILDRTANVYLPTSVLLQNQITVTATAVEVYSPFQISSALVTQKISPGASASYLTLAYALSLPYAVISMNGDIAADGGNLNVATLCTADAGVTPCGGAGFPADPCTLADYDNNNNGCIRLAYIQILHGQCELTGSYIIDNVVIDCYQDLPEEDCPINQANADTTIVFSLETENFCTGMSGQVMINDAVSIERFIFVDPENRERGGIAWSYVDSQGNTVNKPDADTPIEALEWGAPFFGRVDFTGLKVYAVDLVSSQIQLYGNTGFSPTTNPPVWSDQVDVDPLDYVYTRPVAGYEDTLACKHLGLCFATQSFLIQHTLGSTLLDTLPNPGLGYSISMELRLLLDVSYEIDGAFAGVRRRRQLSSVGNGPAIASTGADMLGRDVDSIESGAFNAAEKTAPSRLAALCLVSLISIFIIC
ncbi:hypothetical protein SARC_10384 [Sphaeroforma arctica JP610]|uniref:EGF-like domain-containing protein n=1 Tax=Sphaeroforma arctica JP610 TaxID=667725 RepID=A0A0L0FM90_9EUKA|nr:hypothetical protein SARC_10384 [Sphaeroforma arctica JP610]KNC77148.1 hypothetical protein SARC_10384 [Sphaeroforma arctica JP610]|eukprot:XP_014151050.1 hypothetical protein SARC_10384 [Sphaeroforma arctica JP610]